jgi:hypothetical protein
MEYGIDGDELACRDQSFRVGQRPTILFRWVSDRVVSAWTTRRKTEKRTRHARRVPATRAGTTTRM